MSDGKYTYNLQLYSIPENCARFIGINIPLRADLIYFPWNHSDADPIENYRVKGINKLIAEKKDLKVILLDDAYQHRYVNPGLSILLIDYNRPLSKDHLLPFGNLREPSYEKRRANIIIITKSPKKLKPIEKRLITKDLKLFPYQTSYFTTTKYGRLTPVFNSNKNILTEIDCKKNKSTILLVTGIANPRSLKKHIRGISPKIDQLNFPDHHSFTEEDIQHIIKKFKAIKNLNKIIITTEKDAMRFQNFMNIDENIKSLMYFIPIGIEFPDNAADIFNNQIINYVRKNKRNSILYSK